MARKTIAGLIQRGGVWHVDKIIDGQRVCRSTGTCDRREAEGVLIRLVMEVRQRREAPPVYTVRDAMIRYLKENAGQRSIKLTGAMFKCWEPLVGDLQLDRVCDETLAGAIQVLQSDGNPALPADKRKPLSARSVNIGLQRLGRLLSLASRKWRAADGSQPWLVSAPPALTMLQESEGRAAPLSWDEQRHLLAELPADRAAMAEFLANSGAREQEVCKLRWSWEVKVAGVDRPVFVVPENFGGRTGIGGVKNKRDRVIVLNAVAARIIESRRGIDPEFVFGDGSGRAPYQLNGKGWRGARARAAEAFKRETGKASTVLPTVRVHDLKHTFGLRLRSAGVVFVDRQELLGHKTRSVTDDYSSGDLLRLMSAADAVLTAERAGPSLIAVRRMAG
jgi:integrase